ncbi:MAG: 50S ribosomal protein L17 [Candidatus Adiutrix sp.]|jgi:large subunit ribosomal protein L17|nr:50S ribosomal protein L17 [Candidatus Adiutrix sp.]
MRHRKANVKLGRTASHRDAMLRNMVTSLFEYDRITTTVSKAKALRPLADHMIGLAKNGKGNLHAFRQAAAVITKRTVLDKIFDEAAGRFSGRPCGYTVMVKTGLRKGDAAPMVILELVKADQAKATVGGGAMAKKSAKSAGDRSKRVAQSKTAAPAPAPAEEAPAVEKTEEAASKED